MEERRGVGGSLWTGRCYYVKGYPSSLPLFLVDTSKQITSNTHLYTKHHSYSSKGRRTDSQAFFLPQDFMTAVSLQCKVKNHHPEWSNVSLALDPTAYHHA